jgi:hypothetical protein
VAIDHEATIEAGTWAYMRATRRWHFDTTRSEPEFRIVGTIPRDDIAKIRAIVPSRGDIKNLQTSMSHRPSTESYFDRVQAGNLRDAELYGFTEIQPYAEVADGRRGEVMERLRSELAWLLDLIPLADSYIKVHHQHPGQLWPIHFDNYHALNESIGNDPSADPWADPGVRRLWVALDDWAWGQFVQIGNQTWSHWTAGDIAYFDWLVPHGSANSGHSVRSSMMVTGRLIDRSREWLESTEPHVLSSPR